MRNSSSRRNMWRTSGCGYTYLYFERHIFRYMVWLTIYCVYNYIYHRPMRNLPDRRKKYNTENRTVNSSTAIRFHSEINEIRKWSRAYESKGCRFSHDENLRFYLENSIANTLNSPNPTAQLWTIIACNDVTFFFFVQILFVPGIEREKWIYYTFAAD
jgi:hypothetical protein